MKRTVWMLSLLMAASWTLVSCLSNDDNTDTTTYPDMAITSFTLGTMNRYQHTTSSVSGNDTVVKSTFSGSLYPMTIDHLQQRIYNMQPMPVGTDAAHVICTVGTKNNGVVYVKNVDNDTLYYHQTSDSVDLSRPRIFRVFAIDGSGSRDYEVTLNVSATQGTDFAWLRTDSVEPPTDFAGKYLAVWGDSVRLVARGVVTDGLRAYRLSAGGVVENTTDLETWNAPDAATVETDAVKQLVGATLHELIGLGSDGRLRRSVDQGATWQDELLDDDAALLPQTNIAMTSWEYAPAADTDYLLLAGNDPQHDGVMSLWRKISPWNGRAQWVYMTPDDINRQQLPRTDQLSLASFDSTVLATGVGCAIYQSRDQGITWQKPSDLQLPATVSGTAATLVAGADGRLWLMTDKGEIWEGAKR